MEVTGVCVKLIDITSERLKAFCTLILDGEFVIRELKIIEGPHGDFVAMPSRKLTDRCTRCGNKNHLRARYCNDCGNKLVENRANKGIYGRTKLHADVAHPIHATCRQKLQQAMLAAYHEEVEWAKQPGYQSIRLEDDYDDETVTSKSSQAHTDRSHTTQDRTIANPQPEQNANRFGEGILE